MIKFSTCKKLDTSLLKGLDMNDCNKFIEIDFLIDKDHFAYKIMKEITGKDKFHWIANEYHTTKEVLGNWIEDRIGKEISITIFFRNVGNDIILPYIVDVAYESIVHAIYDTGDTNSFDAKKAISNIEFNFIVECKNGSDI